MLERKVYKLFDILVNNNITEVWQREETHSLGKQNGSVDNWWAKVERCGEFEWVPYINIGTNRPCWGVTAKTGNIEKLKWDRTSIRSSGFVEITCNNRVVYRFCAHDIHYGLAKAQQLIYEFDEHPFNFSSPDSEIGRKIWYMNQPAIVHALSLDLGSIEMIYDGPDPEKGFNTKQPWHTEEDDFLNEWNGELIIRDDVLSEHIWWFRD